MPENMILEEQGGFRRVRFSTYNIFIVKTVNGKAQRI